VSECDHETSTMRRPMSEWGCCATRQKKKRQLYKPQAYTDDILLNCRTIVHGTILVTSAVLICTSLPHISTRGFLMCSTAFRSSKCSVIMILFLPYSTKHKSCLPTTHPLYAIFCECDGPPLSNYRDNLSHGDPNDLYSLLNIL
jgi:hypothetical protein